MVSKPTSLTADELRSLLSYDPETGLFTWLVRRGPVTKGQKAGRVGTEGYIFITINRRSYGASRLAWFYMTGEWPADEIDHENTVNADNSWTNLRNATRSENQANRRLFKVNRAGLKGVCWHEQCGKWQAQIGYRRKIIYLGLFDTKEAAGAAYVAAAKKYYGEFARAS